MSEFIFYFVGIAMFVGFVGAILTRSEAFPGTYDSHGKYPETLIFWVIGISAVLAFIFTLS